MTRIQYCKSPDRVVEFEDYDKRFHSSGAKLGENELVVLKDHKAVQCDSCKMWLHNGCSFITETQYETFQNTNCTGFARNVYFSTFQILVSMTETGWLNRFYETPTSSFLNPSKGLGYDELHPRVLKELAIKLGPVFAHLFQQSFDTGEIPKEWSLSNICSLYKKGDRALACNYHPISLTCVPSKLLEHIVCSNTMAHLNEYIIFSDTQRAFRNRHSCETQLTSVINDSANIFDNGGQVDTFILDFEKAFDTPPHELLKSKLFCYGIGGKTLKWIDSFLCYR